MIHVRAQSSQDSQDPVLHISFVGLSVIQKFQELLNRSLNCAPEFGDDWFALSDKLHNFIEAEQAKPKA